jgi:uncharacterized protein (TIGR03089 family)
MPGSRAHPGTVTTPADLLASALAEDGARPLLTYYDDDTGARVELSVATTANWVAKVANLLVDSYGIEPGDDAAVRLPVHWQTAVVLLACWSAGARVGFDGNGTVTFTTADSSTDGATDVGEIVLGTAPMGGDLARLAAAEPDVFVPEAPSGADLVEAAPVDLPHAARVLTTVGFDQPASLAYGLIGPLAVSGSAVLVANPAPELLAGHAETERVTHTLGVSVDGIPRLDR